MKFAQNYLNTTSGKYPLAGGGKRRRRRAYGERISHRSDLLNNLVDSSRPVIVKWADGRARRYASIQSASDSMGISRDTLHYQLKRKTASRRGYTISYAKEAGE